MVALTDGILRDLYGKDSRGVLGAEVYHLVTHVQGFVLKVDLCPNRGKKLSTEQSIHALECGSLKEGSIAAATKIKLHQGSAETSSIMPDASHSCIGWVEQWAEWHNTDVNTSVYHSIYNVIVHNQCNFAGLGAYVLHALHYYHQAQPFILLCHFCFCANQHYSMFHQALFKDVCISRLYTAAPFDAWGWVLA